MSDKTAKISAVDSVLTIILKDSEYVFFPIALSMLMRKGAELFVVQDGRTTIIDLSDYDNVDICWNVIQKWGKAVSQGVTDFTILTNCEIGLLKKPTLCGATPKPIEKKEPVTLKEAFIPLAQLQDRPQSPSQPNNREMIKLYQAPIDSLPDFLTKLAEGAGLVQQCPKNNKPKQQEETIGVSFDKMNYVLGWGVPNVHEGVTDTPIIPMHSKSLGGCIIFPNTKQEQNVKSSPNFSIKQATMVLELFKTSGLFSDKEIEEMLNKMFK